LALLELLTALLHSAYHRPRPRKRVYQQNRKYYGLSLLLEEGFFAKSNII